MHGLTFVIIFGFLIILGVTYLGAIMIPKMFGKKIGKHLGYYFIGATFLSHSYHQSIFDENIFVSFGYIIPLVVAAYIVTGVKKDFLISKITRHPEWNYSLIASGLLGLISTFL